MPLLTWKKWLFFFLTSILCFILSAEWSVDFPLYCSPAYSQLPIVIYVAPRHLYKNLLKERCILLLAEQTKSFKHWKDKTLAAGIFFFKHFFCPACHLINFPVMCHCDRTRLYLLSCSGEIWSNKYWLLTILSDKSCSCIPLTVPVTVQRFMRNFPTTAIKVTL